MLISNKVKPGMFVEIDTDFSYSIMFVLKNSLEDEIFEVIEATHGLGIISYQMIDIKGTIQTKPLEKLKQEICKIAFTGKIWK